MAEMRFDKLVKKYFNFLVREHGYKIYFVDQSNYPSPSVEDGEVEIASMKTSIFIMKSRGDYDFRIGPYGEPLFTRMFPLTILSVLGISFEDFPGNVGLNKFEWFLVLHAQLLKTTYLKPFLDGDFSGWLEILELDMKEYKKNFFENQIENYQHMYLEI